jgi:hypothetical protein
MSMISVSTPSTISALSNRVKGAAKSSTSLQQAAQGLADAVYETFGEALVLTRVFGACPLRVLPTRDQTFVKNMASSAGQPALDDGTLTLSLLGTQGVKPAWRDRYQSAGHLGIPLASKQFVQSIPMISRLLTQMVGDLSWIDDRNMEIVTKKLGKVAGVFYVADAKTETDEEGRKIIAAQDFVEEHDVKTVFGIGGTFLAGLFIALILFARESVSRERAESFSPLIIDFKSAAVGKVITKQIYP